MNRVEKEKKLDRISKTHFRILMFTFLRDDWRGKNFAKFASGKFKLAWIEITKFVESIYLFL